MPLVQASYLSLSAEDLAARWAPQPPEWQISGEWCWSPKGVGWHYVRMVGIATHNDDRLFPQVSLRSTILESLEEALPELLCQGKKREDSAESVQEKCPKGNKGTSQRWHLAHPRAGAQGNEWV
eukprot:RCo023189